MSPARKTINFELNGRKVSAEVSPHHTLVELLQNEFNLFGKYVQSQIILS